MLITQLTEPPATCFLSANEIPKLLILIPRLPFLAERKSQENSMGKSFLLGVPTFLFFHFVIQFSYLQVESAYTFPDKYFINCGSASTVTVAYKNFIGDLNSGNSYSPGQSTARTATNSSVAVPELYRTARVYKQSSAFKIPMTENGTYVVRLHFYPFSTAENLQHALFNVSASGVLLLSNFSVTNATSWPVIKEFLLKIDAGSTLQIVFAPSSAASFAFVNAIEAFVGPDNFTQNSVPQVGNSSTYEGLLSNVLQIIHRINMGGDNLAPGNDTLNRYWVRDDEFLLIKGTALNQNSNAVPTYHEGNNDFIAPPYVYQTAKHMNKSSNGASNLFNITWNFPVDASAKYLVRLHFCDIISLSLNLTNFNLYINKDYLKNINPFDEANGLAIAFFKDWVVDSGSSGYINISIGALDNSDAFLNGLEIMKLIIEPGSNAPGSNSNNKNLYIIVGSAVGGLILAAILIVVIVFILKRKKQKSNPTLNGGSREGSSYTALTDGTATASPLPNLGLKLSLADILYATKNFDKKLMIGEGGFGKVFKGTLRDGSKVAVKRSEPGHGQGEYEFQTEILVLSKIRHRHLVSLIGYCDEKSEMILVYEFMAKGTLRDHLYEGGFEGSFSQNELSWTQRLEICIGAARGLHYLHTGSVGGIIHRDVKSTNILLDENFVAKVADFGLSRSGPLDQTHVSTGVKGSFGYLDPEYFRCLQLTDKSDVYSFGVVLLEVICARPAIQNSVRREKINLAEWGMVWLKKGELDKLVDPFLQGQINPNSLRKYADTAEKCLQPSGVDRPTMGDVLWDLEYALQLQRTAVHREPFEDSTTTASLGLPLPAVGRLPSHSYPDVDEDMSMSRPELSDNSASEVFSQLRMDEAR